MHTPQLTWESDEYELPLPIKQFASWEKPPKIYFGLLASSYFAAWYSFRQNLIV